MSYCVEARLGEKNIVIETGKLAKQASGAVTVRCGDTIVLVTATASKEPKPDVNFLPLTVDYIEKTFAAGKIPGGFFKREGRPSEREILTSRVIDRPLRPLFPEGYMHETQLIATVLSADLDNEPDVLAVLGASAALLVSPIPFTQPVAGVRVGRLEGSFVCNPSLEELDLSDLDLIIVGLQDAIVMVEGSADNVSESVICDAIEFAHSHIKKLIDAQMELYKLCQPQKWDVASLVGASDEDLDRDIRRIAEAPLKEALAIPSKQERNEALASLEAHVLSQLAPSEDNDNKVLAVKSCFEELKKRLFRCMVLNGKRIDGRKPNEIRSISIEVGLLPRAHGSALFTRGETQALATVTLGTAEDQQLIDNISGEYYKQFMLHYDFPPFSVGEVRFLKAPGRREIGHGALAEKALKKVLPTEEKFPYTMRVVSEILESNGSSSMATVCGGSLALMDAGVPIRDHVAGIAMGLVKDGERFVILSDIIGDEDHMGDMDLKLAGTRHGVTAVQMDLKIAGITSELLRKVFQQAREGYLYILSKMEEVIAKPRSEISPHAPRIMRLKIDASQIGNLIGPGGKNVRKIVDETGVKIDISDDGDVHISGTDMESIEKAAKMVKAFTISPQVGRYYKGKVKKILDFGAVVEILPGIDGLIHISQLANYRVGKVSDILSEGDEVVVKLIEIESDTGRLRLSRKSALGHEGEVVN